jgi:hypothetical protein
MAPISSSPNFHIFHNIIFISKHEKYFIIIQAMVDCKKIFGDVLIKLSCSVNHSRVSKKKLGYINMFNIVVCLLSIKVFKMAPHLTFLVTKVIPS